MVREWENLRLLPIKKWCKSSIYISLFTGSKNYVERTDVALKKMKPKKKTKKRHSEVETLKAT